MVAVVVSLAPAATTEPVATTDTILLEAMLAVGMDAAAMAEITTATPTQEENMVAISEMGAVEDKNRSKEAAEAVEEAVAVDPLRQLLEVGELLEAITNFQRAIGRARIPRKCALDPEDVQCT